MSDDELETDDPAAAAFARLEGEVALVRRAVQQLAAENAEIRIPDYSATLGELSKRLGSVDQTLKAIVGKPAMEMTPEDMAQRIDRAARLARQTDQEQIRGALDRYDHASRELRGLVATVHMAHEQHRRLWWASGGGLLAGCLLWSILPGAFARALPQSWQWPERMAAHTLRLEPWAAGERMLARIDPERWQTVLLANRIVQENRDKIVDCRRAADESATPKRCAIMITPEETSQNSR